MAQFTLLVADRLEVAWQDAGVGALILVVHPDELTVADVQNAVAGIERGPV